MKNPADMTNEEIRQELSKIAMTLHDNPPSDLGEIIERREVLRNEVRSRPATPSDVEALKRELVGLKRQIGIIQDERINPAGMSDGGVGGDGPLDGQNIAWSYDDATGRHAIESRIEHIERRLAES